ncbi:MAG: exonuclease subunit SbcD [Bacteroidales bacterium]|nr:exonuclease subunit SbcD [Bacteroidales bacterium]
MKFIHTADLHIGQVLYQNYGRTDEHDHFFSQLTMWCRDHRPDALLVSGDVFDIQQPGAYVKEDFTRYFVTLIDECPDMDVIITAGNHDSASRLHADRRIWKRSKVHIVGLPPVSDPPEDSDEWMDDFIIRLEAGYVVALPHMTGGRSLTVQALLDKVAAENTEGKPVVMMGHLTVSDADVTGHDFTIGNIKTTDVKDMGTGYDYLALGHIHRPQTIGHQEDVFKDDVIYPSGVVRYSGSPLHVSCDETYPHSVSLVEIKERGADVDIHLLNVDQLRHFYVLPENPDESFGSSDEALKAVGAFVHDRKSGYFRLRIAFDAAIPSDFNQLIYDAIKSSGNEVRYNPKVIWTGVPQESRREDLVFEVADLQQMTDPMEFVGKTLDRYQGLDLEDLRKMFMEVEMEVKAMKEDK